jgi:hypothetical protein
MEEFGIMWEIFYELSEDTQQRILNSAVNLMDETDLTLPQAIYVIFKVAKHAAGKEIVKGGTKNVG